MWRPSEKYFIELFCRMARMTTPRGHEAFVWSSLPNAPHGAPPDAHPNYALGKTMVDGDGNYIVHIPGADDTLWVSHCDTADSSPEHVAIRRFVEGGETYVESDGTTILGADDKVGCAIMACMIKCGVPGWYLFASGEESGCIGSGKCAARCEKDDISFKHVISFDRKGYSSIITHQMGMRTASDEFADALATMLAEHGLQYQSDQGGVYTDSNEFSGFCSECTNLSVGYFDQHTHKERANLTFAWRLCLAMIDIGHRGLPEAHRDPYVIEYIKPKFGGWSRSGYNPYEFDGLDDRRWWDDPDYMTNDEWRTKYGYDPKGDAK